VGVGDCLGAGLLRAEAGCGDGPAAVFVVDFRVEYRVLQIRRGLEGEFQFKVAHLIQRTRIVCTSSCCSGPRRMAPSISVETN
jgi:hypothetical protein